MNWRWLYWCVTPLVLAACVWVGYHIGYQKASLDFIQLATQTPLVTPSSHSHANTLSDEQGTTDQKTNVSGTPQQSPTAPIQELSSLLPETIALTLIDIIPETQLAALMQQTTRISVDKLLSVDDPRTIAKQLLVASNLLDEPSVPLINNSTLGYSDLQVSTHVNVDRRPTQSNEPLYARQQRLYVSFEALADQSQQPHYLIKIAQQGATDLVIYFKFFTFVDTSRQYVWVEREWLAGDYVVELFVLSDALEQLQATNFTILPAVTKPDDTITETTATINSRSR